MAGRPHQHGPGDGGDWEWNAVDYAAKADLSESVLRPVTKALLEAAGAGVGVRLLDVACGPGHTTAAAQAMGADALGLDASEAMVELARRRFPQVHFQVGRMERLPAGPWDAIVCRFGAHHVDPAWLKQAVAALHAGGRIALAEVAATGGEQAGKRSAGQWQQLLAQAGFVEVTAQRIAVGPTKLPGIGEACVVRGRKPT